MLNWLREKKFELLIFFSLKVLKTVAKKKKNMTKSCTSYTNSFTNNNNIFSPVEKEPAFELKIYSFKNEFLEKFETCYTL